MPLRQGSQNTNLVQIFACRPVILSARGIEKNRRVKVFLVIVNGLVTMTRGKDGSIGEPGRAPDTSEPNPANAAVLRPTEPQRRYLERGLTEPGGKLPLFDRDGRAVPRKTVESCLAHGWAERWIENPIKPDWLVCRLTPAGHAVLRGPQDGQSVGHKAAG